MSVLNENFLLGADAAAVTGISRSLRFNSADSAYLNRTPASAGNRQVWSFSVWAKRNKLGAEQYVLGARGSSPNEDDSFAFYFNSSDQLLIGYGNGTWKVTTQVFRDPSSWYHLLIAFDSTQGTGSNRVKLFVNGTQVTTFSLDTAPTLNLNSGINKTIEHRIASYASIAPLYGEMMLADCFLIDGQALTPTSFGEFDATTGVWNPIPYTGSYGTNGFHLEFADNSAATATTLGKDTGPNGNNWTPNNFSVTQGTGNYNGSTSGSLYSGSWINAFNGVVAVGTGKPYNYNTTSTLTFPTALSGTIEVYGSNGGSTTGGTAYIALSDGSQWSVAGITASNAQWYNFGSKTNITSVSLVSDGSSQGTYLGAIRVNGIVLVDNSFGSGNDSLVDVPTNGSQTDTGVGGEVRGNYATWNPLTSTNSITLANGNLYTAASSGSGNVVRSTILAASGKWYFEVTFTSSSPGNGNNCVGVVNDSQSIVTPNSLATVPAGMWLWRDDAYKVNNGTGTSYGTSASSNDVIMVAFDVDAGKIWFGRQGTWFASGNPASGTNESFSGLTGSLGPCVNFQGTSGSPTFDLNAGQRAFAYTAPSGYKALCTANLPAPLVTKPSTVMDVALWTGNDASRSITFAGGLSPDLVWIKSRSVATSNGLFDAVRGVNKGLFTNTTGAEITYTDVVNSFNSSGFTLGADDWTGANETGNTYVGWAWDAGSSTVSNTQGSITSSVRANATAGFSVVGWTSDGSASITSVGHGLNAAPQFIVFKNRDAADNWVVIGHPAFTNLARDYLNLNTTGAKTTNASDLFSAPTSTTFAIKQSTFGSNGNKMIAYCFAPVVGYSAFGSYTGNGSTDGPFVYTGFRPRWVLTKPAGLSNNWIIRDTARDTANTGTSAKLAPNLSDEENNSSNIGTSTQTLVDFLSNGFKVRSTGGTSNDNGVTYIYAAFAESPFNYSRAR